MTERLTELAEVVRSEWALADQAAETLILHAIAAGEALNEAKTLVPAGQWIAWVTENAPDGKGYWACQYYMRLANLKDQVDTTLSIGANLRLLAGVAAGPAQEPSSRIRHRASRAGQSSVPPVVRAVVATQPLEPDPRIFKYGEPGRTALGRAVRQLALAKGVTSVHDALLDVAAIATAWAERLASKHDRPNEEAA